MTNSKILKAVGISLFVVGICIGIYGLYRIHISNNMLSALMNGNSLFGSSSSSENTISIWKNNLSNAKYILYIGIGVIVSGFIIWFSGLLIHNSIANPENKTLSVKENEVRSGEENNSPSAISNDNLNNISNRLEVLIELKNSGLISDEEYQEKRKQIISAV